MRKLKITELNRLSIKEFKSVKKNPVIVVLDNIRSLHNIGSVFRTSDAFLVQSIYLCGITATPPHKDIHKTALGASESVDWQYFKQTMEAIHKLENEGYTIIATEQTDESIPLQKLKLQKGLKYAFVFGHEVKGVDQEVIDHCDSSIEIPQFGTKHSLNISVSAGIVLWEVVQQLEENLQEMAKASD